MKSSCSRLIKPENSVCRIKHCFRNQKAMLSARSAVSVVKAVSAAMVATVAKVVMAVATTVMADTAISTEATARVAMKHLHRNNSHRLIKWKSEPEKLGSLFYCCFLLAIVIGAYSCAGMTMVT